MRMVAGSRPVLVIVWEWHIGLVLLCGCLGALEYPTTNSCGPINESSYPKMEENEVTVEQKIDEEMSNIVQ